MEYFHQRERKDKGLEKVGSHSMAQDIKGTETGPSEGEGAEMVYEKYVQSGDVQHFSLLQG